MSLFHLFSSFQTNINFFTWQNVHPVQAAEIRTHDPQDTSLLPLPLDQGSRPRVPGFLQHVVCNLIRSPIVCSSNEGGSGSWNHEFEIKFHFWICSNDDEFLASALAREPSNGDQWRILNIHCNILHVLDCLLGQSGCSASYTKEHPNLTITNSILNVRVLHIGMGTMILDWRGYRMTLAIGR